MSDHAGGSAWLDAVLYDGTLSDADPLLDSGSTGASALTTDAGFDSSLLGGQTDD